MQVYSHGNVFINPITKKEVVRSIPCVLWKIPAGRSPTAPPNGAHRTAAGSVGTRPERSNSNKTIQGSKRLLPDLPWTKYCTVLLVVLYHITSTLLSPLFCCLSLKVSCPTSELWIKPKIVVDAFRPIAHPVIQTYFKHLDDNPSQCP